MRAFLNRHAILLTLLLVLAVMTMIFCFSAQKAEASNRSSGGIVRWALHIFCPDFDKLDPDVQKEKEELTAFLVRKTAHLTEYALLGLSLYLHVTALGKRRRIRYPALLSQGIGVLYAASDELHQCFVPGRSGAAADVLLDSVGILFGIGLLWLIRRCGDKQRPGVGKRGEGKKSQ